MAIDKRISYRFGGHPGASHEGVGSGQTSGGFNGGHERGGRYDPTPTTKKPTTREGGDRHPPKKKIAPKKKTTPVTAGLGHPFFKNKSIKAALAKRKQPSFLANYLKGGLFSGPEFDKYTKQMSDFYSNSPSKFSYDVNVNKAAQDFLTDKIRSTAGPTLPGGIPTGLATAAINFANIPGSIPMSLAHDAVQSKQRVENQFIGASPSIMAKGPSAMDYVSGFMNEQPFRTAASRAIGIASAFPGVEPAGKWLGEKVYNLMNPSKALASGGLVNLYRHGGFSG